MGSTTDVVAKEQLLDHFSHQHSLSLVHLLQLNHKNGNSDDEDEDEAKDDFVVEVRHGAQCGICKEQIWSFHICYYYCKSCDYSLHTFCAELPKSLQNHPSHPDHLLRPSYYQGYSFGRPSYYQGYSFGECWICKLTITDIYFNECDECIYCIDAICATMSKQKIKHPSHPHLLERMFGQIVSICAACGDRHDGVFFQCTTCDSFRINSECALLPTKLLIQSSTNGTFIHSHPLTLAYSFSFYEIMANFSPVCRLCKKVFNSSLWIYKCDKCRYYVHVDCATSKKEPFMSILLPPGLDKTYKNYKEDEHPNVLHCPFPEEGDNLMKRYMSNQMEFIGKQHDVEMLNHFNHQHRLILFNKHTSVGKKVVSLHDPMKRVQLLCDGCVKPIMTIPFYMCCQYVDEQCCFVLHEWCAKLPYQIQNYFDHPEHPLILLPKIRSKFFGMFDCEVHELESNGFAYGCTTCKYYVDINCAFIPEEITHDAHPNHLILKVKLSSSNCEACDFWVNGHWGFQCPFCDFNIHMRCALLLPRVIKHKCDRHPLSLSYDPAENHIGEYFCEICEYGLNPWQWFYHCTTCDQSMHSGCVLKILQHQQAACQSFYQGVYRILNVKFGGMLEIKNHPHRLSFLQGLRSDRNCIDCRKPPFYPRLLGEMIFKYMECEIAFHFECAASFASGSDSFVQSYVPYYNLLNRV